MVTLDSTWINRSLRIADRIAFQGIIPCPKKICEVHRAEKIPESLRNETGDPRNSLATEY